MTESQSHMSQFAALEQKQTRHEIYQVNEIDILPVRDIKKRNNQFTNSPIHQFKVLHKGQRAFQNPFSMVYYLKKHFKPCFFILKGLKDIL